MSNHAGTQTNGASLEDCHANFFSLVRLFFIEFSNLIKFLLKLSLKASFENVNEVKSLILGALNCCKTLFVVILTSMKLVTILTRI